MSPHYKDQAKLFSEGRFRAQHMDKEMIVAGAKNVLVLKPNAHNKD